MSDGALLSKSLRDGGNVVDIERKRFVSNGYGDFLTVFADGLNIVGFWYVFGNIILERFQVRFPSLREICDLFLHGLHGRLPVRSRAPDGLF